MSKKYYLAGPMQGYPEFNFPLFKEVTALLRARGLDIISPAELDEKEHDLTTEQAKLDHASGDIARAPKTWGDYLARDVKLVSDQVDGIIMLPRWEHSRGARLECFVGILAKKSFTEIVEVRENGDIVMVDLTPAEVLDSIYQVTGDKEAS